MRSLAALLVLLFGGAGAGCTSLCVAPGCADAVVLRARLNTATDEPVHLSVRACLNGSCSEGAVSSEADSIQLVGSAPVLVTLESDSSDAGAGARWVLRLEFGGALATFYDWAQDGDRVEITLRDEDTGRSSEVRRTIVYATREDGCDGQCRIALLDMPAP